MPSPNPLAAIFAPGGPFSVTRIEIEILDSGRPRLLLWNGAERVYSAPVADEDLELVPDLVGGLLGLSGDARTKKGRRPTGRRRPDSPTQ